MNALSEVAVKICNILKTAGADYVWLEGDETLRSPLDTQFGNIPEGSTIATVVGELEKYNVLQWDYDTQQHTLKFSILGLRRATQVDTIFAQRCAIAEWLVKTFQDWADAVAVRQNAETDNCIIQTVRVQDALIDLTTPLTEQGWLAAQVGVEVDIFLK